ncbi:MAG: alpha/beta hydrolase fold domain-containing protein [Alsobacter sp.]
MPLHPETRAFLARMAAWQEANKVPPRIEQSVEESRHWHRQSALQRPREGQPVMASEEDVMLPTRAGPRRARVYRPAAAGPLPTLVYVHGGGYVVGGIEETEAETRRFAAGVPANVVSLSYRLAPEHPWPAAIDDVEDLVSAVASGGVEGVRAAPLALAGVSAGAGLVAAAARRFAERGTSPVGLLVLLSPWLDMTLTSPASRIFGRGHQLEREVLMEFCNQYVPPTLGFDHPELSAALHPVPAGFPETILLAAECDPLADDAALFARRLAEAGVAHALRHVPGMLHGFHGWYGLIPALAGDLAWLDGAIRERMAKG